MSESPPRPARPTLATWRGRFQEQVKRSFLVRFHMALMLGAVAVVGMIASRMLSRLGLESMALRYPLAVLASYLAFFVLVRLWVAYVHGASPVSMREPALAATLMTTAAFADARSRRGPVQVNAQNLADGVDASLDVADGGSELAGGLGSADEGLVIVLLILFLLAIFGAGIWLVVEAPLILTEVAFSAVLAGAIRRADPGADGGAKWAWKLFRRTAVAFAIVTFFAGLLGFGAQAHCPGAVTLREALSCEAAVTAR